MLEYSHMASVLIMPTRHLVRLVLCFGLVFCFSVLSLQYVCALPRLAEMLQMGMTE